MIDQELYRLNKITIDQNTFAIYDQNNDVMNFIVNPDDANVFEEVRQELVKQTSISNLALITEKISEVNIFEKSERMLIDSNEFKDTIKMNSDSSDDEFEQPSKNPQKSKFKSKRQIEKFFSLNEDDDDVLLLDLNEEIAKNAILSIAPGENKKPVPWLIYPDIHELTFPQTYGGQKFNLNKISYTKRVVSELRRADRRACTPEHVLYMAKEKQER